MAIVFAKLPKKQKQSSQAVDLFTLTQAAPSMGRSMDGATFEDIHKEDQMKRYYSEDEPLTVLPELDQLLLQSNLAAVIENLQLAE
jgi:hypothetical protein